MKGIRIVATLCLVLLAGYASAQRSAKSSDVYVDKNGVIRWSKNNAEIQGFGVNYTAPFAHGYSTAKKRGVNLEKAIADDVYHFARLGLDLYRVHIWDTEISDTLGNLLVNEHTKLFDFMIMKMKERGMKYVLTPIAYWGNGWPSPDEKTPGFSAKYGKDASLTNEGAIKAQENYLAQFLNHVNEYTGVAYKNDPDLIGFEISNEPHHRESPEKVIAFINRMSKSMRSTGCKKPIFYNITHSIQLADAYFNADIQGGTFQWYPTGLGSRHELEGNLLPNVDAYVIPFADNPKFKAMAKMVYEFDAADVGRSYIYPAMARSFRTAGMQIANHFAYDPTYMADVNTEYGTHYMNLVYAPQKALSLKIAGEVFHNVPTYKSFGAFPGNTSFGPFSVSYENDLAVMNTAEKFIYTNSNTVKPLAGEKLTQIAGFGNSEVVKYNGAGAYFLDRLENGVWRLEVMPDAVWIDDPFTRTSPKKEVAVINWSVWQMTLTLGDLGSNFSITAVNSGNTYKTEANETTFEIAPGSYLIKKDGINSKFTAASKWNNITVGEFAAPAATVKRTHVIHNPVNEVSKDSELMIKATIVSPEKPASVELFVMGQDGSSKFLKMGNVSGYEYEVLVPKQYLEQGFLKYNIVVTEKEKSYTYPSGKEGKPWSWEFYDDKTYVIRIVPKTSPIYLFDAATDEDQLSRQWVRTSSLMPLNEPGKAELLINVEKLFTSDPENVNGEKTYDYSARYFFSKKISGRREAVPSKTKLIVKARSLNDKPCPLQIALITADGMAYGSIVTLKPEAGEYVLILSDLKSVKLVTLPRPYPTFLPYYFKGGSGKELDLSKIESIQLSIGPGIPGNELQNKHGIAIESIRIE
jgi:hypothetical protein